MGGEWQFRGVVGDALVYEKRRRGVLVATAYIVPRPDGAQITAIDCEIGSGDRQALETIFDNDLEIKFDTHLMGDPNAPGGAVSIREWLTLTSRRPVTGIKTNRGRKGRSYDELREFASNFAETRDPRPLKLRRAREVMRQAEAEGIVEIVRVGRRNVHRILPEPPREPADKPSGARERAAWERLHAITNELEANWERQKQRNRKRRDDDQRPDASTAAVDRIER